MSQGSLQAPIFGGPDTCTSGFSLGSSWGVPTSQQSDQLPSKKDKKNKKKKKQTVDQNQS